MFRSIILFGCLGWGTINSEMPLLSKKVATMIEDGKLQYNLVKSKSNIPVLGSCWKKVVARLHSGCEHLNDKIQSDLALGFANCFLEGSGLSRHECDDSDFKEVCMKSMPDRAFIAYTEFFTHTQSMCFFIMSQVWHEETEETIDRLSVSAADVARQLEASEELQVELLNHQRQSVAIQRDLLENGHTLGHLLHESRDSINLIFGEFRSATVEQQRLLGMVFHHLSALQSWVVGEVSWLDSVAFYVPSFAIVFLITSTQRSANARIPSYVLLICAALTERLVANILLKSDNGYNDIQPVEVLNEQLNWWIWLIRRFSAGGICVMLAVILYRYYDREEVMHQLLQQIQNQNEELLKCFQLQKNLSDTHLPKVDQTDGVGYVALPHIIPSPSVSNSQKDSESDNSSISSVSSHCLIPTFKRDGVPMILEDCEAQTPTFSSHQPSSEYIVKNSRELISILEVDGNSPISVGFSSTPKRKSDKEAVYKKSPVSPRYNLRGRISSPNHTSTLPGLERARRL